MVLATSLAIRTVEVSYYPSVQDEVKFEALSASSTNRLGSLPQGFPKALRSDLVWRGKDIEHEPKRWTLELTEHDLKSIDEAMQWFDCELHKLISSIFPF